jgi:activator of HSP90 ATPase
MDVLQMSPTPGAPFELFGGNVVGKVVSVEPGKKIVQSWQLKTPTWPTGKMILLQAFFKRSCMPLEHFGTMTITFDQGEDSTLSKLCTLAKSFYELNLCVPYSCILPCWCT